MRNEKSDAPRQQAGAAIYIDGLDGEKVQARNRKERAEDEAAAEAARQERLAEGRRHHKPVPRIRDQRALHSASERGPHYSPRLGREVL